MTVDSVEALRRRLRAEGRLVLQLKITPKSPQNAWSGTLDDGTLKVRIAAVPEKGRANAELLRFLAQQFDLPLHSVQLITGAASTRKQVRLSAPASPAP